MYNNDTKPLFKIIIVLFLGFIMLEFFFAVFFGSPNTLQKYSSFAEAIISFISLIIVGAFFFGLYKLFEENLAYLKPFIQQIKADNCSKCGVQIKNGWGYCAFCGSEVKNAATKV